MTHPEPDPPTTPKVVLSYGLGADSTALLLRWIYEPDTRPFDSWEDLVVVTAHTGDEFKETGRVVTEHVLPLMREHGIRYVQLARKTASQTDGVEILDDSTRPTVLHLDGAFKLSEELRLAGTVPQAGGTRKCSLKSKGWPIDTFLADEIGGNEFLHAMGFEYGEQNRATRDKSYDRDGRNGIYPLVNWRWDREACLRYIEKHTGVYPWPKSACTQCPFCLTNKAGKIRTLDRMEQNITESLLALELEYRALCLNPQQGLIAGDRLVDAVRERDGKLWAAWQTYLAAYPHCIYEVRRLMRPRKNDPTKPANASRWLAVHQTGSRAAMLAELERVARRENLPVDRYDGIGRVYVRRYGNSLPTAEHFYVAGPAGAEPKSRPNFEIWWQEFTAHGDAQLTLAA